MPTTTTKEEVMSNLFEIFSEVLKSPKVNAYTLITKQHEDELIPINILVEIEHRFNVVLGDYNNLRFSTLGEIVDFALPKILNNG